jgi:hypothetical protein
VLVTVTPRLRVHRDEVILAYLKGNTVHMRFVSMKPIRVPVDELTAEARAWLLPSLAPRGIPVPGVEDVEERETETVVEDDDHVDVRRPDLAA